MTQLDTAPPTGTIPAGIPAAPEAPKTKKRRNVVGLIALITAVAGFIFAVMPGAMIMGWVLLPIAFVLGIVALFVKGRKGTGIAAVILSIVGTIAGVIAFTAVVGNAVDDAFGSGDTTVVVEEQTDAAATEGEEEVAVEAAQGSRENPFPLNSTISSDDWTVTVNSFTADANQVVADAGSYNEAAPAGSHYSTVNYTVTYTGDESSYAAEVSVALVLSSGEVVNSYDNIVLLTDSMGIDELYNGGTATGSVAFLVPDGAEFSIRVAPGMFADDVFVQP